MKPSSSEHQQAVTDKSHPDDVQEKPSHRLLIRLGAIALLGVIFGVPAILIPVTMRDVPHRSETKAVTTYQLAIDTVDGQFQNHSRNHGKRRLMSLPENSIAWIQLINPMGRKAPGGGYAILEEADTHTGAIGLNGNDISVTITLPAYRTLNQQQTILTLGKAPVYLPEDATPAQHH